MEFTETLHHTLHPLRDGYVIDEVELDHTIGKDYWLVKDDIRMWLSDELAEARKLAEEKIGCVRESFSTLKIPMKI